MYTFYCQKKWKFWTRCGWYFLYFFFRVRKETAAPTVAENLWQQLFAKLHPNLAMRDSKVNSDTTGHLASWTSVAGSSGTNCRLSRGDRLSIHRPESLALKYCLRVKVKVMACTGLIQLSRTLRGMHFVHTATWRQQEEGGLLLPR